MKWCAVWVLLGLLGWLLLAGAGFGVYRLVEATR